MDNTHGCLGILWENKERWKTGISVKGITEKESRIKRWGCGFQNRYHSRKGIIGMDPWFYMA